MTERNDDLTLEPEDADVLHFRLSRDLKKAAAELTVEQARYLVDTYYQLQDFRIQSGHQTRQATLATEPHALLDWLGGGMKSLEGSIKSALDTYSDTQVPGRWAKSIVGIGPVLAAGLLAHVDVNPWKCAVPPSPKTKRCRPEAPHGPDCHRIQINTAGQVWRFFGLDPTVTWGKGEIRPWNARAKVLAWKIGESFVKVQGNPNDTYGKLYALRKAQEVVRNADHRFADQARATLEAKKFRRDTVAKASYERGELPPARIHARAKRWAVKLFLAHFHHVAFEDRFGTPPPKPYVISILGHGDYMAPPGWPLAA